MRLFCGSTTRPSLYGQHLRLMSGKGAYYKNKFGRGGRGKGRGRGRDEEEENDRSLFSFDSPPASSGTSRDLGNILRRIDGRPYPAYKDIYGQWNFDDFFTLHVDHVQGDAYASPSHFRVRISHEQNGIPPELWRGRSKCSEIALRDFFCRTFGDQVRRAGGDIRHGSGKGWHSAKGGEMTVDTPGQAVLDRTAIVMHQDCLEARFTIALPASGRSVLGQMAYRSIIEMLPGYVQHGLLYRAIDTRALKKHIETVEDSEFLRQKLDEMNLVAFVGNNSVLPRESGALDTPMKVATSIGARNLNGAIPFNSPASFEVEVCLPNQGIVKGMGVRKGVTLVVGGGFHGKSTLLKAIEDGVYNHIPGDGRELVVSSANAVKVRAEDGRCINCVNISSFIDNLPYDKETICFSSSDASGSTSQAAYIQEALEVGCSALIMDEDTCATNFMIRDQRMQQLVSADKEPIKPFISKVQNIYSSLGVSSILVIGGCGEYFDVADQVIMMEAFVPHDVTEKAKQISMKFSSSNSCFPFKNMPPFPPPTPRTVLSLLSNHQLNSKIVVRDRFLVHAADDELKLSCLEQICDNSQTRGIAEALVYLSRQIGNSREKMTLASLLDHLESGLDLHGLDFLFKSDRLRGNVARPRRFEIAAAFNRLRCAQFSQQK